MEQSPHNNNTAPELKILEQPKQQFRFCCQSEVKNSFLFGANSESKIKTYPTVQLVNFEGSAVIRCSLYQANKNEVHAHKLVEMKAGKICKMEPLDVSITKECDYKAIYENMAILRSSQYNVRKDLLDKKKHLQGTMLNRKQCQALEEETNRAEKEIDLENVRLRFEAFKIENGNNWISIAKAEFSNIIHDGRITKDLNICYLSVFTGRANGGEDIVLFVNKLKAKNTKVKVRFFEVDDNGEEIWEADGVIKNIHEQCAIVCTTPAYKNVDIENRVNAFIELCTSSGDARSAPRHFIYKPTEVIDRKRRRPINAQISSEPPTKINQMAHHESWFHSTTSNAETISALPTDSNSPQYVNTLLHQPTTIYNQTTPELQINQVSSQNEELRNSPHAVNMQTSEPAINIDDCLQFNDKPLQPFSEADLNDLLDLLKSADSTLNQTEYQNIQVDATSFGSQQRNAYLPKTKSKPLVNTGIKELDNIFKIYDAICDARVHIKDSNFVKIGKVVEQQLLQYSAQQEKRDSILHKLIEDNNFKLLIKMNHVICLFKLEKLLNRLLNVNGESVLHYACLLDRANFIAILLGLKVDPNLQDNNGNAAAHIAVQNQHVKCLDNLLNSQYTTKLNLSLRNDEGWTVLNLAIRLGDMNIAEKLLAYDAEVATVRSSKDGNNPLHMAVLHKNLEMIELLSKCESIQEMLQDRNNAEQTVMKLAKHIKTEAVVTMLRSLHRKFAENYHTDEETSSSVDEDSDIEVTNTFRENVKLY